MSETTKETKAATTEAMTKAKTEGPAGAAIKATTRASAKANSAAAAKAASKAQSAKRFSVPVLLLYLLVILFLGYVIYFFLMHSPKDAPLAIMKKKIADFPWRTWEMVLYAHIATGTLALAIGPFQFLKLSYLRNKKLHRALGLTYVLSIFASIPMSLYLAVYASGGIASTISFTALAAAWLGTTLIGLRKAFARDIEGHKAWMFRSYAITFVFVTFRIEMPFTSLLFGGVKWGIPMAVWAGMLTNLLFAQWRIRHNKRGAVRAQRDAVIAS